MLFADFKNLVSHIQFGKKTRAATYLHVSVFPYIQKELADYVTEKLSALHLVDQQWDIIKFSQLKFQVSLLVYPGFFTHPYPELYESIVVDLQLNTFSRKLFATSVNPPILHRKETFLLPDHPAVEQFRALTREGEAIGLYEHPNRIGRKRNWEDLITDKGYAIGEDGHLYPGENGEGKSCEEKPIDRHLTAINRSSLSTPVQSLFRHGFLTGQYTLFDYGCGKGDDVRILHEHGIEVKRWDPVFYPDGEIHISDVVNLGFVVNVIEDQQERRETLRKAYRLARKLLVVSVMLRGESVTSKFQPYGDGVRTSRNTFQKYFSQNEFREYVETILNEQAIAVGPGVLYVFRDKLEEQRFLINKEKSARNWVTLSYAGDPERLEIKQRAFYEVHKAILDDFWSTCLELGRLPAQDEYAEFERLRRLCGSPRKAFNLLSAFHGQELFDQAAQDRRNDLLVYFALGQFSRRKPYAQMPDSLQRDIKAFWGKYLTVQEESRSLLFSISDTALIGNVCQEVYEKIGTGSLENGHSYTFHGSFLGQLPPVLRVYVGCATQMYGDLDGIDMIKIHFTSGKVTLLRYDNFLGSPLPLLVERIKVKLREQQMDFFEYSGKFVPRPLYLKSRYLTTGMENYDKQLSFEKRLLTFRDLDLSGYGPLREELDDFLLAQGLMIRGFRFYSTKSSHLK